MEGAQLSFMPKKSLPSTVSRDAGQGFFLTLSIITLLVSGLLYGGVFIYRQSIVEETSKLSNEMTKRESDLDESTIKEMEKISKKIEHLKVILSNHRSFQYFFSELGKKTNKNVRFSTFSYTDTKDGPIVTLSGTAKSYASLALQASNFQSMSNLKGVIFSNLALKEGGNVSFTVRITADPIMFSYNTSPTT